MENPSDKSDQRSRVGLDDQIETMVTALRRGKARSSPYPNVPVAVRTKEEPARRAPVVASQEISSVPALQELPPVPMAMPWEPVRAALPDTKGEKVMAPQPTVRMSMEERRKYVFDNCGVEILKKNIPWRKMGFGSESSAEQWCLKQTREQFFATAINDREEAVWRFLTNPHTNERIPPGVKGKAAPVPPAEVELSDARQKLAALQKEMDRLKRTTATAEKIAVMLKDLSSEEQEEVWVTAQAIVADGKRGRVG